MCKSKAATNVRSNKDATVVLSEPKDMSLDDSVEYIAVRNDLYFVRKRFLHADISLLGHKEASSIFCCCPMIGMK